MDCQMPILDGYSTSRQIRTLEAAEGYTDSKVIIIALTANAMQEDRDRCLASGMDDYLSKPVRKEDLAKKLTHWVQIFATQSLSKVDSDIENSLLNIDISNNDGDQGNNNPASLVEIDWEYLEEISGGNVTFKQELLQAFVSSLPEHIESLAIAISQQQYSIVEHDAHFVKGSSAALGITGIAKLASILEETSKNGKLPDNAKVLLGEIINGIGQIQRLTQSTEM
jgi:HPt (histidine-containing phosphotransfer) domain-containing protein